MNAVLERLGMTGIVPVIKLEEAEKALPLAKALHEGGLPVAEVTFRAAGAAKAIAEIAEKMPEVLVGAGTVLSPSQADEAIAAGAQFVVSPGLNPKVVARCLEKGVPVVPGCSTPSDMEAAMEMGLDTVKFFPAEQAGGLPYLKAVSGPYPKLRFIATGGIGPHNLCEYLAAPPIFACGGSWMVKEESIATGDLESIRGLCRTAVDTMLSFRLAHLGANCHSEAEAQAAAARFAGLFGLAPKSGNSSVFAGKALECMKMPGRGTQGHIAISTPSVERAAYHLSLRGAAIDESSRKTGPNGQTTALYLQEEVAGFAIHLIKA